jgi:hypothetical protein
MANSKTYTDALFALYGDTAYFEISNERYEELIWYEENTIAKPTQETLDAKIQELNDAEPIRLLRQERDKRIAETDWWVLPDRTPSDEQLAYRQALRDITDTYTSLEDVVWPTKPE